MDKRSIGKIISITLAAVFCVVGFFACNKNDDELIFKPNVSAVGVWWWHTGASDGIDPANIEFAAKNGITEIYYAGSFTTRVIERAADFIGRASEKIIKVYLLLGDWRWIEDDADFQEVMTAYQNYQSTVGQNHRYAGVHMDVEPHQSPDWRTNRAELLQKYIDFVVRTTADYPDVKFDWDIPAWFNDTVEYRGEQTILYKAVIQEANRAFIMSYRDSAEKMVNFSTVKDQVNYAKSLNKQIFLSAECSAPDEDGIVISYKEKGKAAMYAELNKLKGLTGYDNLGVSIHHMRSWLELKD